MEKEKINNIEDFNPIVDSKIQTSEDGTIKVVARTLTKRAKHRKIINKPQFVREDFLNRPIRNSFSFWGKEKEAVKDFINDLTTVSSVPFGIITNKVQMSKNNRTVVIVVSGEPEAIELWQKNAKVLYDFYKNL